MLWPYIQLNKKYNTEFSYKLNASLHPESKYDPENALVYDPEDSVTRYSSHVNLDNPEPYFWSICFEKRVFIVNYTFTEPSYNVAYNLCHQKSWNFYGKRENSQWILIDEKRNLTEHNQANYVGSYAVRDHGPFNCFKIENVESFSMYKNTITFRRFDIYTMFYEGNIRKTCTSHWKYLYLINLYIYLSD